MPLRLLLVLVASTVLLSAQPYDLVITNGRVLDGTGSAWQRLDVAIEDDRIAALGPTGSLEGRRTIDAQDQIVAPGFIDIHNHSRRSILDVPSSENFVRQGVTTVVEGNDGSSPLPIESFFERIRKTPLAVNYATFVGHGSIRREIVGMDDRPATPDEIERMRKLTREAMHEGAFGLSTGLFYLPGTFASTEEVIALAKVAAEYGGMHISHMRDESDGLLDSVRETIRIGEEGGLPTQVTHFKAAGKSNWGRSKEAIALIEAARARGVDVSADQYPYTASHTGTSALFPQWAQEGGRARLLERLNDPETRKKIQGEIAGLIEFNRGGGNPKNVQFSVCDFDHSLDGKTLADETAARGREVNFMTAAETAIEIQIAGGCRAVYHAMSEEDVSRILAWPGTMVASDGGVTPFGEGVPHPRYYGTFPRVLGRYVRELKLISLEDAVRKMTSLPASRLGLWDRGLLRPGMLADVVVFDPDTVEDRSLFGDSHHYSVGISHVLVNGKLVLDDDEMQPARPGRILYGPGREN